MRIAETMVKSMLKDHMLWIDSGGLEGKRAEFVGCRFEAMTIDLPVRLVEFKNCEFVDTMFTNTLTRITFTDCKIESHLVYGGSMDNCVFTRCSGAMVLDGANLGVLQIRGSSFTRLSIYGCHAHLIYLQKVTIDTWRIRGGEISDINSQEVICANCEIDPRHIEVLSSVRDSILAGIGITPTSIGGVLVTIVGSKMQIGCTMLSISEWMSFIDIEHDKLIESKVDVTFGTWGLDWAREWFRATLGFIAWRKEYADN